MALIRSAFRTLRSAISPFPIHLLAWLMLVRTVLLALFGPQFTDDTHGYVAYAHFIQSDPAVWWSGVVGEHAGAPVEVWTRQWGYAVVITATRFCSGALWPWFLVCVQCAVSLAVAVRAWHFVRALVSDGIATAAVFLVWTTGAALLDTTILTDSLFSSGAVYVVSTIGIWVLGVRESRLRAVAALGCCLAGMYALREMGLFLMALMGPLFLVWWTRHALEHRGARARLRLVVIIGTILVPLVATTVATRAWNNQRIGERVDTLGAMSGYLYTLVSYQSHGVDVLDLGCGDAPEPPDACGQTFAADAVWPTIHTLHSMGFSYGMLAEHPKQLFWDAWRSDPGGMAFAMVRRVSPRPYLDLFNPAHTAYLATLWATGEPLGPWSHETLARLIAREPTVADGVSLAANGPWQVMNLALMFGSFCVPIVVWRRRVIVLAPAKAGLFLSLWVFAWGALAMFTAIHVELRYLGPVAPWFAAGGLWVVVPHLRRWARRIRPIHAFVDREARNRPTPGPQA